MSDEKQNNEKKLITLSIRDFAVPTPRTGSIDAHSGYGRATLDGIEIHQRVQKRRAETESKYEAEVRISREFEREGYTFLVRGAMDGVFSYATPRIEEIKTTFNLHELKRHLLNTDIDHPYCLQLKTYGYFYFLEHSVLPKLSFHLVSTRTTENEDLDQPFDVDVYEAWLERRLAELVIEAKKLEKRTQRRKKVAQDFPFPFEKPRPGQIELIETIKEGMKTQTRMLVQAPTGLGKTAGVLYPTLQEAMARGQGVVYVTPKNTQHSVAEDAVTRFQDTGSKVKSLTITAKSKICFKAEPLCNPSYCEYARDYYAKVSENGIHDILDKNKKLHAKTFKEVGEEFQVCPFELQLEVASQADVVICDYNYVFGPKSPLGKITQPTFDQQGKSNLVIDEAHNLPPRAMDYYSPALSSVALENMREDILELPARFRTEAEELLDECVQVLVACRPTSSAKDSGKESDSSRSSFSGRSTAWGKPQQIDPPAFHFMDQDTKLRTFLSRYLDSDVEIKPRDVVLRLCFYWSEFTGALEFVGDSGRTEFFTTYHPHPTGGTVKITCCDASQMLEACYDDYEQVVGFSATLKPFSYYAKLSGLDLASIKTAEFQSPFERKNRKLLIIPQISTKYSERDRNIPKIAETIRRISELRSGNYFAFFPSFDFMEKVLDQFTPPEGFAVFKQERNMKHSEVETIMDYLRSENEPMIVFAVQGGVFSEGVDYPGKMIIGAFVVGPPLPSFDIEREQMRKYYEENYKSGFDYAYTFPAMAKAVQAAGRVIRSETDRGIIVLMDNRFIQSSYTQSMPKDWFDENPRELVSNAILKEVKDFWAQNEDDAEVEAQ
jgi:DNA excision repair protein ERCC-2